MLGVFGELLEPAAEDKGSAGGLWFPGGPLAPPWPGAGASGEGETPSASGPGREGSGGVGVTGMLSKGQRCESEKMKLYLQI